MRQIRISIFMAVITLICIGMVMVYSCTAIYSYDRYGETTFFLKQHLLHLIIGAILATLVMSLDVYIIRRWVKPLFFLSLILLILVFVPSFCREVAGARRWLRLGIFSFQPSELVKWTTVLFFADILSVRQKESTGSLYRFLFPLLILGVVCVLILMQPDLGSAVSIGVVGVFLFFVAGISLAYIITLVLLSFPVLYFSIFNVAYRRKRILAFLNPWADARGTGFQIIQSYLGLGLGGFWGVGLGQSRQKLFYLPAAHTDFIFSIIGEELGLIGTASIVILFMLFFWQGMKISFRSQDPFVQLLSFGIVTTTALSAFIHIAVVCGALPTKGLPLPFISYGGSALVFNMMAVGLLLNAARDKYMQGQKIQA